MERIQQLFSKFYSALPARLRVYIYVSSSILIAALLGLIGNDLLRLKVDSEYLLPFITFITGFVNELQKEFVARGTRSLALEGDEKTIEKLDQKIEEVKSIRDLQV